MRACRIDKNQPDIVKVFRDAGFSVLHVHQLKNCCDIIVAYDNCTAAIEIKDGNKSKSQQKLTTGEKKFKDEWKGLYYICNSKEQALDIIDHMK